MHRPLHKVVVTLIARGVDEPCSRQVEIICVWVRDAACIPNIVNVMVADGREKAIGCCQPGWTERAVGGDVFQKSAIILTDGLVVFVRGESPGFCIVIVSECDDKAGIPA